MKKAACSCAACSSFLKKSYVCLDCEQSATSQLQSLKQLLALTFQSPCPSVCRRVANISFEFCAENHESIMLV